MYLDVHPEVVSSAGRQTAMTSSDWSSWAGRTETTLRTAAGGSHQTKVTNAFENYLARWNPTLRGLATRAETLGTNATAASCVVGNADADSAGILSTQTGWLHTYGAGLTRPVNAGG